VDLSAFYFDMLKDRLYTFAPHSRGRRSAQTAVHRIAGALVRLVAPTLVFTAEEVWKHLPHSPSEPGSVHMTSFPVADEFERALDDDRARNWERLLSVREQVLKALEQARVAKAISGALEARVTLSASGDLAPLLQKYAASLPALFIVSQADIVPIGAPAKAGETAALSVEIRRADGGKCDRCWNYSTHVGESAEYPTVCERCLAALSEISRDGDVGTAKPL
jgi:isoleucyl-tRNA synthetase